jgi:hypothetical protein
MQSGPAEPKITQRHEPLPGTAHSQWLSVVDVNREQFAKHPWSVSGGGKLDLQNILDAHVNKLRNLRVDTGMTVLTLEDDVYLLPAETAKRLNLETNTVHAVMGDEIRDFAVSTPQKMLMPVTWSGDNLEPSPAMSMRIWNWRTNLRNRLYFGQTPEQRGLRWFDLGMFFSSRHQTPLSIPFSFVATHNHFALDHGGKVFKQSAPTIKLPAGTDDIDHLKLLGILNSSTACFWLKQVSHDKGNGGIGGGIASEEWEKFYEFTSTKIQDFPLPVAPLSEISQKIDNLAKDLHRKEPSSTTKVAAPTRSTLTAARIEHARIRSRMVALQEELDWEVYGSYGLLSDDESQLSTASNIDAVPEIELGERAFEITLARDAKAGQVETAWFSRHGSTPITEIPSHWPQWYQNIVQARIDIIEKRPDIALIERPEYKRRWATVSWEKREAEALRNWLLDRCEKPELWFALRDGMKHPRTLTVSQLADQFRDDADMNSVAQLYATDHLKKRDLTLAQILEQVIADQHVPYLAALRYKDTGLRKREQWEEVWELQREEDRTGKRLDIPVPPKYGSGDFRKTSYWSQRGKLDVPKERFISYPDASPDADPTLLLGWAGWDHKDQAQALVNTVNDRTEQSAWSRERLTPLLAGLLEVLPWVKQWHGEYDDEWGGVPADEYDAYLTEQRAKHQLTEDDLRAWRPAAPTRGRRAAKKD